jgi:hypothetical protein
MPITKPFAVHLTPKFARTLINPSNCVAMALASVSQLTIALITTGASADLDQSHWSASTVVIYQASCGTFPGSTRIDQAQTFTAGMSGRLTAASFWMARSNNSSNPIEWSISGTDAAGAPSALLASGTATAPSSNGFQWVGFDLSQLQVYVTTGNRYALVVTCSTSFYNCRGASNLSGGYAGGSAYNRWANGGWSANADKDFFFQTFVTVPTPAVTPLFALAGLTARGRRRK